MTNNNKTLRLFHIVAASLFLLCVVAGASAKVSAPAKFKSEVDTLDYDVRSNQGDVPWMTIAQASDRERHSLCQGASPEKPLAEQREKRGPINALFDFIAPVQVHLHEANLRDEEEGPASAYRYLNSITTFSLLIDYENEVKSLMALYAVAAGDCQEAEKIYRELIEKNKGDATYYKEMGTFLELYTDRSTEALLFFEKALELSPQHPVIMHSISRVLNKQGRLDEALEMISNAVSLMEKSPYLEAQEPSTQVWIMSNYGGLLWETGNKEKAVEIWCDAMRKELVIDEKRMSLYLRLKGLNDIHC